MIGTLISQGRGFDFDRQTEPSGVTIGQTWRERSAGGVIVADWEWNGSLWLSVNPIFLSFGVISQASTVQSSPTLNTLPLNRFFIQSVSYEFTTPTPCDGTNSWIFRVRHWGTSTTDYAQQTFNSGTSFSSLVNINVPITTPSLHVSLNLTRNASAPSLTGVGTITFRRLR